MIEVLVDYSWLKMLLIILMGDYDKSDADNGVVDKVIYTVFMVIAIYLALIVTR